MNITSAQYITMRLPNGTTENSSIKATIDDEEMFVPMSEDNRHYQAIIEWAKEDSNEIAAAD